MLDPHAARALDPERVGDGRAEDAHHDRGDPGALVEVVAGAAENCQSARGSTNSVSPAASAIEIVDEATIFGESLHRDRVRGVAEAREERRQQADAARA